MQKTAKKWWAIGILVLIIGIVLVINVATRVPAGISVENLNQLNQIESIYTDESVVMDVENSINEKRNLLGESSKKDYDLYVGIAQIQELLGEGGEAYKTLMNATEIMPEKSLAYRNLGSLFVKAGLISEAEEYFKEAIDLEPQMTQNHSIYIDYYVRHRPEEISKIKDVFELAREKTNDNSNILKQYASWLSENEEYVLAIDIWKLVLNQGPSNEEAIRSEIVDLTQKINSN